MMRMRNKPYTFYFTLLIQIIEEAQEYDKKEGFDKYEEVLDEDGEINYEKLRVMEKKGI